MGAERTYMLKGLSGHVLRSFEIVELIRDIARITTHVRICLRVSVFGVVKRATSLFNLFCRNFQNKLLVFLACLTVPLVKVPPSRRQ